MKDEENSLPQCQPTEGHLSAERIRGLIRAYAPASRQKELATKLSAILASPAPPPEQPKGPDRTATADPGARSDSGPICAWQAEGQSPSRNSINFQMPAAAIMDPVIVLNTENELSSDSEEPEVKLPPNNVRIGPVAASDPTQKPTPVPEKYEDGAPPAAPSPEMERVSPKSLPDVNTALSAREESKTPVAPAENPTSKLELPLRLRVSPPPPLKGSSCGSGVRSSGAYETAEEIRMRTPTVGDVDSDPEENVMTCTPAPPNDTVPEASRTAEHDSETESCACSEARIPRRETEAAVCKTEEQLVRVRDQSKEITETTIMVLALLLSNLALVLTVGGFVTYNAFDLRKAQRALAETRARAANWTVSRKTLATEISNTLASSAVQINSTFDEEDWGFQNINLTDISTLTNVSYEIVENSWEVAQEKHGRYYNISDLVANSTARVCQDLDSALANLYVYFNSGSSLDSLIAYIRSVLNHVSTVVASASGTATTMKSSLDSTVASILSKVMYMMNFVSIASPIFFSKKRTFSPKAKQVAVIYQGSSATLSTILSQTQLLATITYLLFGTGTLATDWMYDIPKYDAILFDLCGGCFYPGMATPFPQKYLLALMDRGGSVFFPFYTLGIGSWDSRIYSYCGISATKTYYYNYGNGVNMLTSCQQIYSYPADLTTVGSLSVQPHYDLPLVYSDATALYDTNGDASRYYLMTQQSATTTQKCAMISSGLYSSVMSNEAILIRNVVYWLLYNHYPGN